MEIKSFVMSEGGYPVVFYLNSEDKKPITDVKRIGLLSIFSKNQSKRDFPVNYLGPLNNQDVNDLLEDSELEKSVFNLIAEGRVKTIETRVCDYPLVLLSFDEIDYFETISLISFGKSIKSTTRKLTLHYTGNIELFNQYAFLRGGFGREFDDFVLEKTAYMKKRLNGIYTHTKR